jgi:hypothetical protein
MNTEKWLLCPICKNIARIRVREDTELKNFLCSVLSASKKHANDSLLANFEKVA